MKRIEKRQENVQESRDTFWDNRGWWCEAKITENPSTSVEKYNNLRIEITNKKNEIEKMEEFLIGDNGKPAELDRQNCLQAKVNITCAGGTNLSYFDDWFVHLVYTPCPKFECCQDHECKNAANYEKYALARKEYNELVEQLKQFPLWVRLLANI